MLQQIIIGLIFIAALLYLGQRAWESFFAKKAGCAKGCGCSDISVGTTKPSKKASAV